LGRGEQATLPPVTKDLAFRVIEDAADGAGEQGEEDGVDGHDRAVGQLAHQVRTELQVIEIEVAVAVLGDPFPELLQEQRDRVGARFPRTDLY